MGYNAQAACTISSNGKNWNQWTAWTSGAYKQYIPEAESALGVAPSGSPIVIGGTVRVTTGLNVRTEQELLAQRSLQWQQEAPEQFWMVRSPQKAIPGGK